MSYSDSSDKEMEAAHKPKRKMDISRYQENEAEDESGSSNDDENEYSLDYEDDEEMGKFVNDDEEDVNESNQFSIYHQNKRSGKSKGSSEKEEISRIAKNYQNQDYYDRDTYQIIDDDAVNTTILQWRLSLIPTSSTKKLFLVHVKPSKELAVVYFLLRKYFHRSQILYPTVYSAFYTSKGSGIIFVEAITSREVTMIKSNVPNALQQQIRVVPTNEMTACLSVPIKHDQVVPGQFVRIRRDNRNESYQNDLAQVISVDTNSSQVLVKLVPRIDYAGLESFRYGSSNRDDDDEEPIGLKQTELTKEKNKSTKTYRPPQEDFNLEKLKRISSQVERTDSDEKRNLFKSIPKAAYKEINDVYFWDNTNFYSTFAYKVYPIDRVTVSNLSIGPEEPKKFIDGLELTLFEKKIPHFEDNMYESLGITSTASFGINDIALINEGEYNGLAVKILAINEKNATVKPLDDKFGDVELQVEITKLSKYFKPGDHVKVTSGSYHDQTGEVLVINDKTASVVLDTNEKVIDVYTGYLVMTHEINQGQKSIGNYNLFDFVRLTDNTSGVIWRIENGTIYILLTTGTSKTVSLDEIASRQKDRSSARDTGGRPIIVGQTVVVDTTELKQVRAQVKHIAIDVVFLHNDSSSSKYNGLFVVEPHDCQASTSPSVSAYNQPSRYTSGRSPTDKKLLGKTIMITSGKFKNQLATIKGADKASIRVIMHNTSLLMTLNRSDEGSGSNQSGYDNRGGNHGIRWKMVSTKDDGNDAFSRIFTQKRKPSNESSRSREQSGRGSSISSSYGNNYGQQPPMPTYGNDYYRQQSPYNTGQMSSAYGSEYPTPYQAQSPPSAYQQPSPYAGSPYSTSGTPYQQYDRNQY
ncbi:hypothetical protein M9Y10_034915 [Tritrichomonas musculus]|uniref:KOW domain-containing protein n=1 Tax=Tritrichomonas musculus TaxID=1915356 RepID=A0ABR2KG93_9EUKA